jgi:O-antigen/teichoic acid export membrane protein
MDSTLLRNSAVYTLSSTINAVTSFLLLPVLTRYLTPAEYGLTETCSSLISALVCVLLFGANTTLSKEYFGLSANQRGDFIATGLILIGIAGIFLSTVLVPVALQDLATWKKLELPGFIVLLAALGGTIKACFMFVQTTLQLEKRAMTYALFVNGATILEITVSVLLIVVFHRGWQGRVWGLLISQLVIMATCTIWLRQSKLLGRFKWRNAREILGNSPMLVLSQLSGWGIVLSDRLVISYVSSSETAGLYAVAARFASVLLLLSTSISLAWMPFFQERIRQTDWSSRVLIVRTTYVLVLGYVFAGLVYYALATQVLPAVVPNAYASAVTLLPPLICANCIAGIWKAFTGYLVHTGRLGIYSSIGIAAACINIVLIALLVPRYGPAGASWALLVSMTTGAIVTIVCATSTFPMPWLYFLAPDSDGNRSR